MSDSNPSLIPVGYMLKSAPPCPDWIKAPHVREIASVSHCHAKPFADYTRYWRHNGMGLFDTPQAIFDLIAAEGLTPAADLRLYYYEAYPFELAWNGQDQPDEGWRPYPMDELAPTRPIPPDKKRLLGYDVVAYGDVIECSPLSCNAAADHLAVNACCLCETFDAAMAAVDQGRFEGCEEGKYRIFAVYEVERWLRS